MRTLFSSSYYKGPKSDHFDGARFYNPWNPRKHSWGKVLRWRLTTEAKPWPEYILDRHHDTPPERVEGSGMRVSFVGHATVLVQTQGLNILTDPVWSKMASPVKWAGPRRVCDPGISFDKLPKIDLVLISHNHYDHMDQNTVRKLWQRHNPVIVTPLGNDAILRKRDRTVKAHSLDWGQSKRINDHAIVHLEASQHWSGRGLWDRDEALWGSFVVETPRGNIYFAGDTGYNEGNHFREAQKKFGKFRLAMLPIGAYEPRWFMNYAHLNPEEAVLAHQDLGSMHSLGIHFGTFRLSDESYEAPLQELAAAKQKYQISDDQFRALRPGQVWNVP